MADIDFDVDFQDDIRPIIQGQPNRSALLILEALIFGDASTVREIKNFTSIEESRLLGLLSNMLGRVGWIANVNGSRTFDDRSILVNTDRGADILDANIDRL